jgi:hypothetical protein
MKRQGFVFLVLVLYTLIWTVCAPDATHGGSPPGNRVGWPDLGSFSKRWLSDRWATDGWDGDADFDGSYRVDFFDFALWAQLWSAEAYYVDVPALPLSAPLSSVERTYVVNYDPYADVDWNHWYRALAQHHDHMGRLLLDRIRAYDEAGYNVIVPLDYAGKGSGWPTYCNHRLWPVYKYLRGFDSDEQVLAALNNIKLFVPGMEEIGCHHVTSPFLTTYIELWEPEHCPTKQPWQYETTQECIDLINQYGGLAIIAHPTARAGLYKDLSNYKGIEIFNAYYYQRSLLKQEYPNEPDNIGHFQSVWDFLLMYKDARIWGFAVNDWFGPWKDPGESYSDSGKILVMIPAYTLTDYRSSIEKGCFFAVQDWGQGKPNKNKYPVIAEIKAAGSSITIDTDGDIIWIANGEKVAQGNAINLTELPPEKGYKYVRAEVSNAYGTVYTQPWSIALFPQ